MLQRFAPHSKLLRAQSLIGGISAQMTALEIEQADGQIQKWVLRQPRPSQPQAAKQAYRLLQSLYAAGLAVPRPLYLDETREIFPTPYLVIEYIEGQPEFAPTNPTRFAQQIAAQLAKIHQTALPPTEAVFLKPIPQGFHHLSGRQPIAQAALPNQAHLYHLLQSQWPPSPRNAPVLLHGDFWPGNWLWHHEQLAAVIDWEDAALGDPLMDFAICRFDLFWIFGPAVMNLFSQHYQSLITLDPTDLPYWDLFAALRIAHMVGEDLNTWAAFFHPLGRTDITAQTIMEHYNLFTTQALDRLTTP